MELTALNGAEGGKMNIITELVANYGLLAMFIIITLEYACFPVSSEFVLPFCGAVAAASNQSYLALLLLSILAGLIGTGICYMIGWFGGATILHRISQRFPKSQKGIEKANDKFMQYGSTAVCIGRVIPLIRTYIALVAGAARLDPISYFTASALGISIWNTVLIGLGYVLRDNYDKVADYYDRYKQNLLPILVLCIIGILGNLIYQRQKKRKLSDQTN
jgi:membrane protein DedA with SNARE-associated domain